MGSAVVFAAGSAFGRALGFLLLPLWARLLDPAEFGVLAVVTAVSAVTGTVLGFGVEFSVIRVWFEMPDARARRGFLASLWRLMLLVPAAVSALAAVVAWLLMGDGGSAPGWAVALGLLIGGLYTGSVGLPLVVLRVERRLAAFLLLTIGNALVAAVVSLLLVLVFEMGAAGLVLGGLAGTVVALGLSLVLIPWERLAPMRSEAAFRAIRMGLGIQPHIVAMQSLVLGDRLIIASIVSAASLGVYGIASNLALPLMLAVQAINQALQPRYSEAGSPQGAANPVILERVVKVHAVAVVWLTVAAILITPPVITALLPADYWGAKDIVVWLLLGFGFLGLYSIPMNGAGLGVGRTKGSWLPTGISALTNIALVLLLVPTFGIEAAAVSSAVGYLVLLGAISVWAHTGDNIVRYPWRSMIPICLFVISVGAFGLLASPSEGFGGLAQRLLWALVALIPLAIVVRRESGTL